MIGRPLETRSATGLIVAMLCGGCGNSSPAPAPADAGAPAAPVDIGALMDSANCQTCHPGQYQQWAGSMHAYATDDPVFQAMNARAQRESNDTLGTFCVNCHAPMAVRTGMTDGTNLDSLPASLRGVTCYFCHSVTEVTDTHNAPLTLDAKGKLYGPFDPVAGVPHSAAYSPFLDGSTNESAQVCGSCHDIVNLQGAHVERTFAEWRAAALSQTPNGETCAECHMAASTGFASETPPHLVRQVHDHTLAGVDLALGPFPAPGSGAEALPENQTQELAAQAFLDTVVQATLCLNPVTRRLQLTLDNAGASGHGWPTGATPDRRAWVELIAYQGGQVIYASGNTQAEGTFPSALPLEESSPDPDLWLIRDCIFDAAGAPLVLFWQTAELAKSNQLPGLVSQNAMDPNASPAPLMREFPSTGTLPALPDHVTVELRLQAIGDDVLDSLVASGDLDPSLPSQIARYTLGGGAALDWTPTAADVFQTTDTTSGAVMTCVANGAYQSNTTPAISHARCEGLASGP
ncbi:MAG TPA: multiheme c-type cytochrome [Polyangiaceae bacterium]|nr:multiheme c-type cytochrome [Polyangiaceae bacterium]